MKAQNANTLIKVAVGLSGGVDSSVAAYLLKEQGYDVTGIYMQCWDSKADGCKADEDRADAVKVASKLGIKFEYLDFIEAYKNRVIDYFYKEYELGRTPNPDVMCNKEIKFGLFFDWAIENEFDYVATGHYARSQNGDLLKGVDDSKDQSYFLYLLEQHVLEKTLFPLGALKKEEVRKTAEKVGLHTFDKPDSVGICFIGEVKISDFLKKRIKEKKGEVLDLEGNVIGEHDGIPFYTIGQRHGFSTKTYHGAPLYVVKKIVPKNQIVVGTKEDCKFDIFNIKDSHWINESPIEGGEYLIRIRHLGEFHKGTLEENNGVWTIKLAKPVFGVAEGQSAVVYKKDLVIGGGVITF